MVWKAFWAGWEEVSLGEGRISAPGERAGEDGGDRQTVLRLRHASAMTLGISAQKSEGSC